MMPITEEQQQKREDLVQTIDHLTHKYCASKVRQEAKGPSSLDDAMSKIKPQHHSNLIESLHSSVQIHLKEKRLYSKQHQQNSIKTL